MQRIRVNWPIIVVVTIVGLLIVGNFSDEIHSSCIDAGYCRPLELSGLIVKMKPGWTGRTNGVGEGETLNFTRLPPSGDHQTVIFWVGPSIVQKIAQSSPLQKFDWGSAYMASGELLAKIAPQNGKIVVALAVPESNLLIASNTNEITNQIERIENRSPQKK